MKKTAFLIGIALVLSGCTPQVTVTLPPIPTPTLHPQFIALQESIAASGERFTLHADGQIYDGATPIPGVIVSPDGTMSITVDGETITLDPADVNFDDEKGITIDGYELTDTDGDGELDTWVEVNETVTIGEMQATGADAETKAENLAKVDPTHWGFEPGEAQIVVDGSGRFITPAGEPDTHIAEWNFGSNEWEWDWSVMEGLEGSNPLFDFAKTWEMKVNGSPVDMNTARADSAEIMEFSRQQVENMTGTYRTPIYLFDGDVKSETIGAYLITTGRVLDPQKVDGGVVDGWICFKTNSDKLVAMRFNDVEVVLRRFN